MSRSRRNVLEGLLSRQQNPEFLLLRRSAMADPYRVYDELRNRGPILHSSLGYWLVFGYKECLELIKSPKLGALTDFAARPDVPSGRYPLLEHFYRSWFLFADAPRHAEIRKAVTSCTAHSMLRVTDEIIGPLADQTTEQIDWSRPVDIVTELARPFPTAVLGNLLGLPLEDLLRLRRWTVVMSESMEPFFGEDRLRRAEDAARQLRDYLLDHAGTSPSGSGLACLLGGEVLDIETGVANTALLLAAGQETTVNAIGMSVLALLTHRDAITQLEAGMTGLPNAVEELLRFTSPIQLVVRRVKEPVTYESHSFDRGEILWLFLGSANWDPAIFGPPGLRLDRSPNPHVTFGAGTHLCFGAALTRAELVAVLARLIPILKHLELDPDSIRWQDKRTVRGLDRLIVRPHS